MAQAIVFLPLLAAIVAGFGNRRLGDTGAQLVTCGAVCLSAALSIVTFVDIALGHHTQTIEIMRWIDTGPLDAHWAIRLDTLSAVMLCVVTIVSSMVHVYSVGYMAHDHSK